MLKKILIFSLLCCFTGTNFATTKPLSNKHRHQKKMIFEPKHKLLKEKKPQESFMKTPSQECIKITWGVFCLGTFILGTYTAMNQNNQ